MIMSKNKKIKNPTLSPLLRGVSVCYNIVNKSEHSKTLINPQVILCLILKRSFHKTSYFLPNVGRSELIVCEHKVYSNPKSYLLICKTTLLI